MMLKTREGEIDYWKQKDDREYLEVFWADQHLEKLFINIHMDSLQACTHDVIRQTSNWINRIRG